MPILQPASELPTSATPAAIPVLQALQAAIFAGHIPPGGRLPPERELQSTYATSRVTIRTALQTLASQGLVTIRQGSGATVQGRMYWNLELMADFWRFCLQQGDVTTLSDMARTLLAMRKSVIVDAVGTIASYPKNLQLSAARQQLQFAWCNRDSMSIFARAEFAFYRELFAAGECYTAAWILNSLATMYFAIVDLVPSAFRPVKDTYVSDHESLLNTIALSQAELARRRMREILDDADVAILQLLQHFGEPHDH